MNIDIRKQALATKVKWALAALAALAVSPIIFLVVKGLVGLAAAAIVGGAIISFAPVVAVKFANWKLRALKHEARENPIETRQAIALKQREQLELRKQALEQFGAEVRNVESEIRSLRSHGQQADADEMQRELEKLQELLAHKVAKWKQAKATLEAFEQMTERLGRRWKTVQALLRAKKAGGTEAEQAMDKLLAEESADAVQTQMNAAFAELDIELADSRPALEHNPSPTIDVVATVVAERIRA